MIPRHLILGVAVMLVAVFSMGIYIGRMRRGVAEIQSVSDTRPVAPPATGATENVTLFLADDAAGRLRGEAAQIPLPGNRQQRAEELLRALLLRYAGPGSSHVLSPSAELRGVYLVDPGLAVIDMNSAFADQHRSGILDEQLTVDSLVQTVAVNVPGISRVRVLIEGQTRETLAGHADLSEFIDAASVQQAVR